MIQPPSTAALVFLGLVFLASNSTAAQRDLGFLPIYDDKVASPTREIGHLCISGLNDKLTVLEVIDEDTMLAKCVDDRGLVATPIGGGKVRIGQSIRSEEFIIDGFSTKGLSIGKALILNKDQVFRWSEPQEYTIAKGKTSKFKVVRFVPPEEVSRVIQELETRQQEAESKKRVERFKARGAEFHTFTDSTGEHRIEAWLVKIQDGKAHLEKQDGSISEVPLARLSKPDQTWIRDELKRQKMPKPN